MNPQERLQFLQRLADEFEGNLTMMRVIQTGTAQDNALVVIARGHGSQLLEQLVRAMAGPVTQTETTVAVGRS